MEIFKRLKYFLLKPQIKQIRLKLEKLQNTSANLSNYQQMLYKDKPNLLQYLSEEGGAITNFKIQDYSMLNLELKLQESSDNLQVSWTELLMYLTMVADFEDLNQEVLNKMILQVHKNLLQFNLELEKILTEKEVYGRVK